MNIVNNPNTHVDEDGLMLIKNDKSLAEKSGWAENTVRRNQKVF